VYAESPESRLHILILNEYFPPDTSATAKLAALAAETLAERHRVTVVTGRPSYDPTEYHRPYLLRREVHGNLAVERVGSTAFCRSEMMGRVSNYLTYLMLAVPRALMIRSDVVLAMTDPPIEGIVGAAVARLSDRVFVYNIQDLYPDMAVDGGILSAGKLARWWEALHLWALRQASRVIVIGEDMRERILAKGVDPGRVTVVRAAVPFPETLPPTDHPVIREIRGEFRFVLVHAGNLGFYGAWQTLIQGVRMLASEGVGLVFIGEGALKARLEEETKGDRNIRFLPYRPVAEVPYVMAAGDLHVVTVKRGLEGVVVPSKVYPILAAGRPLLALASARAEVARFAQRDGCGVAANPDDPESLAEAVGALLREPERLTKMSQRARELAKTYDRVNELRIFTAAIEKELEG
jgi:glycosyltransferase involved in cell wall biosynthesis